MNNFLVKIGLKIKIKIIDEMDVTHISIPGGIGGNIKKYHYKYYWRWKKI